MSEPLLKVADITCRFAGLVAVDNLSFAVGAGTVHALIGPNGAGKTTLFNIISGLLKPNQGSIRFSDHDITALWPYARVTLGLGRTFQNLRLFGEMTVLENVQEFGLQAGIELPAAALALGEAVVLQPHQRRPDRRAGGAEQRLEAALADPLARNELKRQDRGPQPAVGAVLAVDTHVTSRWYTNMVFLNGTPPEGTRA